MSNLTVVQKIGEISAFRSGLPADIPDPYARMPQGQKGSPHHRGRRKTHFLVRTSTIFGADVHDPKGCRKLCTKKVCVDFLAPNGKRFTAQGCFAGCPLFRDIWGILRAVFLWSWVIFVVFVSWLLWVTGALQSLDDRQITHLTCVRLK